MLAKYASTFRGQPYLLGYELFNEPFPGTPWATCTNPAGCALFDAQLASFYRREIGAIRAADRTHLIFYEPNIFFDFGANTNLVNPDGGDRGTGFAFHDYCLGTGAGTAIPPIPGNGPGCAREEQLVMNDAMSYVRRTHAGLLNTEWGATSDTATITRMAAEFDSDGISWLFWSYNGPLFVRDPRKPPTGSNVNGRIVALLDRPYPRAVAGTPLGWSWDPATRRLQLRYSTSPPAGVRLVPGALTEVWAGAVHYPHGYRVRASGATVASRAQAPVLLLRTRPGAPQVTVTVSPAR
jgi:endoglycosylceramidase